MQVSTIVPTRDRPEELQVALRRIASQTYRPLQVIVVDNASTPENAAANRKIVDACGIAVDYLFSQDYRGPAAARNVGIQRASGALVAFCDDDDYWCDDNHIENAVRAFSEDQALDLRFANQRACINGKEVRSVWLPHLVEQLAARGPLHNAALRLTKQDCLAYPGDFGHVNTCVFRADFLRKIGGFWDGVSYLEDMDLFVRAVDAARHVQYSHDTVSVHNIPNGALPSNASTRVDDYTKQFMAISVANHLLHKCDSSAARRYAGRVAGFAYRELATAAKTADLTTTAFRFATLALMWMPSLRWGGYTALLGIQALPRYLHLSRNGPQRKPLGQTFGKR